jgi:hypothetical protein
MPNAVRLSWSVRAHGGEVTVTPWAVGARLTLALPRHHPAG